MKEAQRTVTDPSNHEIVPFFRGLRGILKIAVWVVCAVGLAWAAFLAAWVMLMPSTLSSAPARFLRYLIGEPGAVQNANDTADFLAGGAVRELESFADMTTKAYASNAMSLPEAELDSGRAVPIERLPKVFWTIGGTWRTLPQVVLRLNATRRPMEVRLKWGHGRHQVIVFPGAPPKPPTGFVVRKVSARTYVLAYES